MAAPITEFALSENKLFVLAPCTNPEGGPEQDADWPNNILSTRTVVYESGKIARSGEGVHHIVDPDELALCRRLAREAAAIMTGVSVGMGSESTSHFGEFFVAADVDAPRPARIDEGVIRRAFGGTIFPPATITVEPLGESGVWWSEVLRDGEGQPDAYFAPWRALAEWFRQRPELQDSAFVRIGEYEALLALSASDYPEGTESTGCVLPRLALGLTRAGSLVGIFGYVVQT
jgi:hypothetical protein